MTAGSEFRLITFSNLEREGRRYRKKVLILKWNGIEPIFWPSTLLERTLWNFHSTEDFSPNRMLKELTIGLWFLCSFFLKEWFFSKIVLHFRISIIKIRFRRCFSCRASLKTTFKAFLVPFHFFQSLKFSFSDDCAGGLTITTFLQQSYTTLEIHLQPSYCFEAWR